MLCLALSLFAIRAPAATPSTGKDALRKLAKLPTVSFDATWAFDPERGFTVGSNDQEFITEILNLRKQLRHDPSDAEACLRIGELYAAMNDMMNARKTWSRAAELYRKRVERQPDDAVLLAGLGRSLQGAGKFDEAESVLRKAVELAPKEWSCQLALGRLLDAEARRDFAGGRPQPGKVSQAKRELAEAGECFDRAVVLAPDEGEVYLRRGMHRYLRTTLLNEIRVAEGDSADEIWQANNQFSEVALADLQHASKLEPKNYRLIASVVLFEIYSVSEHPGHVNWAEFSWNTLPEKSQRSIRDAVTRLEDLGQDADPHQASGALEMLGILQGPILHESRNCIEHLRRALALDPAREPAWEVLAAMLAQSGRYDELLTACQDRVREKESARGHLLLAKAYEKVRQWDDSESEILETLKQSPNNFTANLAEAALLLRRSQDDAALAEADTWLGRCERLLGDTPPPQRNTQLVVDLTLTRSIYFALSDQTDAAKQWANAVINQDRNNRLAQEILSAMDY